MAIDNPFSLIYFPTALMLGALHALEPGHAKTLTAAYLIGIKGTKKDALLLGLSVALTHSLVVIGISATALWVGREAFTEEITHWLQVGSGLVVVILGFWMLIKRLRQMRLVNQHHYHDQNPVFLNLHGCSIKIEIVGTPDGERFRITTDKMLVKPQFRIMINRLDGPEILNFVEFTHQNVFYSENAPQEPHEFSAELELLVKSKREIGIFEMHGPERSHEHRHMSDDEHSLAHAAQMPEYAKHGERPTYLQIITFGAAGGMIPCPASITVMLLSLSIGEFASGLFAVLGFSIGLALALVGIGLLVVEGLSRIQESTGRLHWLSKNSPLLSAGMVMLSGLLALLIS